MKYLRNTKLLIAIFAALVLVPCFARLAAAPSLRERSRLEQARIYRDAGRFYAAQGEYLAAIKERPRDIALHDEYLAAEIHHARRTGDVAAIRDLHERYLARISALLPAGDTEDNGAEQHRPDPDPELAIYLYCYGVLRVETGGAKGIGEGYGLFKEAQKNNPDDPCIRARLAMMQMQSPRTSLAEWGEKNMKIAIEANPTCARNYEELFEYYLRKGRQKEALKLVAQGRANTGDARLLAEETARLHLGDSKFLQALAEYLRGKAGGPLAAAMFLLAAMAAAAWVAALVRQSPVRVAPIKILTAAAVGVFSVVLAWLGCQLIDGLFGGGHNAGGGWLIFENALRSGLIDEAAKFLVIVALVWKLARVRSVVEGMIVGATIGGIFAALNSMIATRGIGADAAAGELFIVAAMEVFGGAIAGFFAAREKIRPSERPLTALAGLVIAVAFKAAFVVAGEIGVAAAQAAFLIVAAEAALAQWLFGRALAAGDWPGRVETKRVRADVPILLGLALAVSFAFCFAVLAVDFRSGGEIARTALPHLLRAGFVVAVFCLAVRKAGKARSQTGSSHLFQ